MVRNCSSYHTGRHVHVMVLAGRVMGRTQLCQMGKEEAAASHVIPAAPTVNGALSAAMDSDAIA